MILKCTVCNKPKEVKPYRKKTFRFCSYKCKQASMIGKPTWNKGLKYTPEQKSKLNMDGLAIGHQIGNKHRYWKGDNHHAWKGDFPSYSALHYWLYRQVGKATYCSNNKKHKSTVYHWANISGEYKRDINDFMQLCPSCHFKHDDIGVKGWKTRRGVVV
jgi:endogenous inhibitor of DNA gyrase (YacG/DUF329 family)